MTREEVERKQADLAAKGYDLSHWYGTGCEKCCGVYPLFRVTDWQTSPGCWYECEVCGTRTDVYHMPWQAEEAWNRREYRAEQLKWF